MRCSFIYIRTVINKSVSKNKQACNTKQLRLVSVVHFKKKLYMATFSEFGKYSRSHISGVPANLSSPQALRFKETIPKFPEEAVYIYSFKENRMIYAHGWHEILGYKDEEINMLAIVMMSSPEFHAFSSELNDKALMFIHKKTEHLEQYGFSIELKKIHKNGSPVPIVVRVMVFSSENGRITAIIGRFQVNRSINFGSVMRYASYGPEKSEFEEELNRSLFYQLVISDKEKETLSLISKGYSYKEISRMFDLSESAIEKRIQPLYKRFNVKSLPHLVSFAYDNYILP
jgi:DNA-binding CsgD family transcriptional regulator